MLITSGNEGTIRKVIGGVEGGGAGGGGVGIHARQLTLKNIHATA